MLVQAAAVGFIAAVGTFGISTGSGVQVPGKLMAGIIRQR